MLGDDEGEDTFDPLDGEDTFDPLGGEGWKGIPTPGTPAEQMWRAKDEEDSAVDDLLEDAAVRQLYYVRRRIPPWRGNTRYH